MATTKIESEIFKIESPVRDVYSLLSDFSRVGKLFEMAKQMGLGNRMQLEKLSEHIKGTRFTEDVCYFVVKDMGEFAVRIVEKNEPAMIKLGGAGGIPCEFNIWIQLLENGPYDTRVRITFQGDFGVVMKVLFKGKMEKWINQLAEGLTKIPYGLLKNF